MSARGSRGGRGSQGAPPLAMRALQSIGLIVVLVVIWEVVTSLFPMIYFPTPVKIWADIATQWLSAAGLEQNVLPSLWRVALGWLIAIAAGVPLGMAFGLNKALADYVRPLIHYARAVPPPVILPIFMIFFGVGTGMKVAFIAFGIVWPILLNTVIGVEAVETTKLETARIYRIPPWQRFTRVVLPSALPDIMAGVRISLSLAFILMVISEMLAASGGIGFQILQSQDNFNIVDMWAGMVVLAIGGVVFNLLLGLIEARILRWHKAQRREAI